MDRGSSESNTVTKNSLKRYRPKTKKRRKLMTRQKLRKRENRSEHKTKRATSKLSANWPLKN